MANNLSILRSVSLLLRGNKIHGSNARCAQQRAQEEKNRYKSCGATDSLAIGHHVFPPGAGIMPPTFMSEQ